MECSDDNQPYPVLTDFSQTTLEIISNMSTIIGQRAPCGDKVRFIPLTYNQTESQTSALRLILTLRPEWEAGKIEFVRFTDGITNTLLKVVNKIPGASDEEIDKEAILLRAYGQGSDLLIDREREAQNHELLMQYQLAPLLLARFHNGMLYKFIRGAVTSPADLRREDIYRAVARRLAEWHAVVPCISTPRAPLPAEINGSEHFGISAPTSSRKDPAIQNAIDNVAPGKPAPNCWTVMQKWIYALPTGSDEQRSRQASLQKELTRMVAEFSSRPGLGENGVSLHFYAVLMTVFYQYKYIVLIFPSSSSPIVTSSAET